MRNTLTSAFFIGSVLLSWNLASLPILLAPFVLIVLGMFIVKLFLHSQAFIIGYRAEEETRKPVKELLKNAGMDLAAYLSILAALFLVLIGLERQSLPFVYKFNLLFLAGILFLLLLFLLEVRYLRANLKQKTGDSL
jgi:hypothetical protein